MTKSLRKNLVGKIIRDVKWYHLLSGESYIKLTTDKNTVAIGATDLEVWIDSLKAPRQKIKEQENFFKGKSE